MNEDQLREFLAYMAERQRIYNRRERGEEWPWTEWEVLQNYHFCNVRRQNDAGTQYLIENILSHSDDEAVFFNVIVYRLFNLPKTYEAMGGFRHPDEFDVEIAASNLRVYGENNRLFSPAYRIPAHRFADSDSKMENVLYGIVRDDLLEWFEMYFDGVMDADSLQHAHKVLMELRGVGEFIAYELVTDLNYTLLPFSEDDWVNVGPGAKRGLEVIFGPISYYARKVYWFQDMQESLFDTYDIDYVWDDPLTCRDFEHSLCEYAKYHRVKYEGGHTRRYSHDGPDTQKKMDEFF